MQDNDHEETIREISKAQMELKMRLEKVSQLKIDCAKFQLELLKLYKPQCLEILELLREVSAGFIDKDDNDDDNDDCNESRNNEVINE